MSNCEIEKVLTKTDYRTFKRTYTDHYSVVNKCDNTILAEYDV
jgi:hypothetical protein